MGIHDAVAAEYADSYGSRRGGWDQEDAFEAGEVFDRAVTLSELAQQLEVHPNQITSWEGQFPMVNARLGMAMRRVRDVAEQEAPMLAKSASLTFLPPRNRAHVRLVLTDMPGGHRFRPLIAA